MIADVDLVLDAAGALYWPDQHLLVLADLHLEKGSSYARRGTLLPPYDSAATLAGVRRLIAHYAPRLVIALGDSFHDIDGPDRLASADRRSLLDLQRGREWIWVTGNHDPHPVKGVGGTFAAFLAIGRLIFRHEPSSENAVASEGVLGEIAGHLHPVARIVSRGRGIRRRCFAGNVNRLVMPAFGAYAGGLNIRDAAFANLFDSLAFTAHLLGNERIYSFTAAHCRPD
ncbi:MAG TPA: ligase-associated DNA damage response endonuclease PdeM [Xanthobacteraceae bacterium]|jgi:hypothetical protein|nr:ligase-associated DNA damage response endonuclease PdeM [Xanthobacteraceae bacterium]